ncbi:hypothetical protein EYR40_002061 [Pleurotus pulmonarius]|nr:hypothetical protein EYR36_011538 [Pleurotus pulmonarius]KAF4585224.1 hypothetical protein EYR40_002061 [Pleurotus pulmonarius]
MPYNTPKPLSSSDRSKTVDSILATSEVLLTVLKDVSSFATVPFMRDAAELCLGLLNAVQAVRGNRDTWIRLVEDIAKLVVLVANKFNDSSKLDKDTLNQIQDLHNMLVRLRRKVEEIRPRNFAKRFIGFRDDAMKLQEYRDALNHAIDLFGVRAVITNAENMQKVLSSQNTLLTAQQRLDAKQDEVLSEQRLTNKMLQKIDTTISAFKMNPSAASSCSTAPPSYSESPARYAAPHKSGFASILPAHANVTIIAGNHVINNINKATNITESHRVETTNTINSFNACNSPVASSNTKGIRGRRHRHFIRQDIS